MKRIKAICLLLLLTLCGVQSTWAAGQYTGDRRALCIYMSFADAAVSTADAWTQQLNGVDYKPNGGVGSVRDYFYDMSYGQFNLQFDCLPYTVSGNRSTYAATSAATNTGKFTPALTAALNGLYSAGTLTDEMISRYDWDGDGYVDQVIIIYAGPAGQNMSKSGYIRSHESEMTALTLGGKKFSTYAACAETRTDLKTIDGIGGVAHEIVHCFGLPDFYTSSSYVMQYWDLMDAGTYNGDNWNGTIPPQMTSFERWVAGWITPTVLTETTDITGMRPMLEAPEAYVLYNTASPAVSGTLAKFPEGGQYKEFFLFENRKSNASYANGRQWDSPIGNFNGMLAIHVDFDENQWHGTSPNSTSSHQRMTIVPAGSKVNGNAADVWKSGTVSPLNVFNGTSPINSSVGNISVQSDGTIDFSFVSGGIIPDQPEEKTPAYYRSTSADDVKDGAEFIISNPWGWAVCEPYYFDDVNPATTWGHYPANKAHNVISSPLDGGEVYDGEVNTPGKPYVFVLETAGDGKYYIKDKATGKYLHGYYDTFISTNRYAMDETDTPQSVWNIEYNEEYNGGEYYLTTTANGQTVYLTEVTSTSAFSNATGLDANQPENFSVRTSTTYTLALYFWSDGQNGGGTTTGFATSGTYEKVTSADQINVGDYYIVIGEGVALSDDDNDTYFMYAPAVTVTDDQYTGPVNSGTDTPYELRLEACDAPLDYPEMAGDQYYLRGQQGYLAFDFSGYTMVHYSDEAQPFMLSLLDNGNVMMRNCSSDNGNGYFVNNLTAEASYSDYWVSQNSSTSNVALYRRIAGQGGTDEPDEPVVDDTQYVYNKVMTNGHLADGDVIILIDQDGKALGAYDSYYGSCPSVSATTSGNVYDGAVNTAGKPYELTLEAAGSDTYRLKIAGEDKYLQGVYYDGYDDAYFEVTATAAEATAWNLSVNDGVISITTTLNGATHYLTLQSFTSNGVFDGEDYILRPYTNNYVISAYKRTIVKEGDRIYYQLAQTTDDITEGNPLLIMSGEWAAASYNDDYWSLYANTVSLNEEGQYEGEVNVEGAPYEFILEPAADGKYSLRLGDMYLYGTLDSGYPYLLQAATPDDSRTWTLTIDEGKARLSTQVSGRTYYLKFNDWGGGDVEFSTSTTATDLALYVKTIYVEPEPEPFVPNTEGLYVRINSADELQSGDEVLFVYEPSQLAMGDVTSEGYNFIPVNVNLAGTTYTGSVNAEGAPYEYIVDRDGNDLYFQQAVSQQWISEMVDGNYNYMVLDAASALPFNVTVDAAGTAALNFTSSFGSAMFVTYYDYYNDFEFSMTSWGDKPNFAIYKRLELREGDDIAFAEPSQYSESVTETFDRYSKTTTAPAVGEEFIILSNNGWWGLSGNANTVPGPGSGNNYLGTVNTDGRLHTFTLTADGQIICSNGKYLNGAGNNVAYTDDPAPAQWAFVKSGNNLRLRYSTNRYLSSTGAEYGTTPMTTSTRQTGINLNIYVPNGTQDVTTTTWYDVEPLAIAVDHGYAAICSAEPYQLPAELTASFVVEGDAGLENAPRYKGGDIVPANTPVLVAGPDGQYAARIYKSAETGSLVITYGDDNLLEATRDAEGLTASTRSDVSYYGLYDGESGYGFYRANNRGTAFPIAEGLAYLAIEADDVRGYLLPDLSVAPNVWIGDVELPAEIATIDDLLEFPVEFQYADEVLESGYGILAGIYDADGQLYAVALPAAYGSYCIEGSVATIRFERIADIKAELRETVRRAFAARIGQYAAPRGAASVFICGKSFVVEGQLYAPFIQRSYEYGGGITTGIDAAPADAATAPIYDLSGRRLVRPAKAQIVIQGGKAVVK